MKRQDLLNAIDELKESESIECAIGDLKDIAASFCDKYEADFNEIRDNLSELAPHIDKVFEAHATAERCSDSLY